MEKITLKVEGISCSHCENAIKKALGALNGVGSVAVDLKKKIVTVVMNRRRLRSPTSKTRLRIRVTTSLAEKKQNVDFIRVLLYFYCFLYCP